MTQYPTLPQKLGLTWRWTDQRESSTIINFSFHVEPMSYAETSVCICKFLQVLLWEKLVHLTDSRGLSHTAIPKGGNVLNIKIIMPLKQVEYPVNKLIRHTWASHDLGSPWGFVSGHTSCSWGSTGLWDLTEGKRRDSCAHCCVFCSPGKGHRNHLRSHFKQPKAPWNISYSPAAMGTLLWIPKLVVLNISGTYSREKIKTEYFC